MRRSILALALLFLLVALTACGAAATPSPATPDPAAGGAADGDAAPLFGAFEAADLYGDPYDESIFSCAKLTMVNIWATFCGPCIDEMPDLGALHTAYADQGFQVVGIVVDVQYRDYSVVESQRALAVDIVAQTGADYLHLIPPAELYSAKLNRVSSIPETIFLDENGVQLGESYIGSRSKAQWQRIIDSLLAQIGE